MIRLNDYIKSTYGEKLYKISLSTGSTCPNRDGKKGYGGCIFCDGSGEFTSVGNIEKQIIDAKNLVSKKYKGSGYIAYFSSFTNTYGNEEKLKNIFEYVANKDEIKIISIATRWDSISENMYDYLSTLSKRKDIWIEFGLQSSKQTTHDFINSKLNVAEFYEQVAKARNVAKQVVAHQIIGLPNEDEEDILNTTKFIINSKINGIKLHLMHVLKNTKLDELYKAGLFNVLSLEEYTNLLIKIILLLPDDMVVHRFTGDGDKNKLVAPLWSADKKKVLNYINKELKKRGL